MDYPKLTFKVCFMWLIKDIPQQHNGIDCGVFVCQYALQHISDKPMTFKQVTQLYAKP